MHLMADFTDIVLFLSSGKSIAWIGSGPSIELGLPTWKGLANVVLEECRKEQKNNFRRIEQLYRNGKYPEQFDEVQLKYGKDFLYTICKNAIADPGGEGAIYSEISKLDFLSYFTTNYDDLLVRHLENSGKAVKVYRKSQDDLEAIDIDMTPSVVKLHGDFTSPDSVVLTRNDYIQRYDSGKNEGFQTFIKSHLGRDRIIFCGYSLNDPEILALQQRLVANLRRQVAPIAMLANATQDDVKDWKQRYNIDVVPYRAHEGDHSELLSMLKSVSEIISVGGFAQERIPDEDLRKAQALYMWHRFSPSKSGQAPINTLESIVLASLMKYDKRATLEELATTIVNDVGARVRAESVELSRAIDQLASSGLIKRAGETFEALPEGRRLVERCDRQFNDLMDVFTKQLALDVRSSIDGIEENNIKQFTQVVLDALIDLFELRGQEIMSMVFDDEPISPTGITGLMKTIWRRANDLHVPTLRASLVKFVLDTLTNPSQMQERVLDYLSRSFFCIQAMKLDPNVTRIVSNVVADRTLIIDENVLIPLTAKYEDRHQFTYEAIRAARESGIFLCTTKHFIDSVRRHANWALDLINEYGIQSKEVMQASLGNGGYDPNAFLRGYIEQAPDDHNRDFQQYLRDCFGGSYARQDFDAFFEEELGIWVIDESQLAQFIANKGDAYEEAVSRMANLNLSRPEHRRKSERRIESEVEVMLLISDWNNAKEYIPELQASRGTFITSGSSVGWIAKSMNLIPGPTMIATAEAVWEILTRLETSQNSVTNFRSMMLASDFRMASHFIQPENYRRFFRPLIDVAKREFEEYRELFEKALGADLGEDFLDSVNDEQLPSIVSGLHIETIRQRQSGNVARGQQNLVEENARLRSTVEKYEERERKRREYVAAQRKRDRTRKGRGR